MESEYDNLYKINLKYERWYGNMKNNPLVAHF